MSEKPKLRFDIGLITTKADIELSGMESESTLETFSRSLLSGLSFRNWWLGFYSFRAMWDA